MANIFQAGPIRPLLLVGLGNPGASYAHSRHNVGFMIIDEMAQSLHADWRGKANFNGQIAHPAPGIFFLKPNTFMNQSGQAVAAVQHYFDIPTSHVVIIYDDRDLAFGKIKHTRGFRTGAHHNGVKSVAQHIGHSFHRLRFGIGNDHMRHKAMHDFVLDDFSAGELGDLQEILPRLIHRLQIDFQI